MSSPHRSCSRPQYKRNKSKAAHRDSHRSKGSRPRVRGAQAAARTPRRAQPTPGRALRGSAGGAAAQRHHTPWTVLQRYACGWGQRPGNLREGLPVAHAQYAPHSSAGAQGVEQGGSHPESQERGEDSGRGGRGGGAGTGAQPSLRCSALPRQPSLTVPPLDSLLLLRKASQRRAVICPRSHSWCR